MPALQLSTRRLRLSTLRLSRCKYSDSGDAANVENGVEK